MRNKLAEHDKRFSNLERQLASVRGDIAVITEMHVDTRDSLSNLAERVERLERRVEIIEPFHQ